LLTPLEAPPQRAAALRAISINRLFGFGEAKPCPGNESVAIAFSIGSGAKD
jgi:hypothetical protein